MNFKKIILFLLCLFPFNVLGDDITLSAGAGILMEYSTGEVLYELNSHEKMAPASMTKIMTLIITMEELYKKNVSLNDEVIVSSNAASMGGSQVFLDANSKIKFEDLLKAIVVASANDAAVVMAEYISGTTGAFVDRMNKTAKDLGCKNTNFVNVHGLDDDNHYTTSYDMALMARELLKYEDILKYTTIYEAYLNKPDGTSIWMVNTNKVVYKNYYNR